jgi:DNA invertase Pin-like site-specific DNA recombinase
MAAIAYYRVSTVKQGQSGLGLEAQKAAVKRYAAANGLTINQEFTEIETGTGKRARVAIYEALAAAKEAGAVLLIAKLDRLARNVHFISGLMESGVKFVAVDMPAVTNLTLHILAAVAEEEAKMISGRTRAALQAAKERGVTLGNPQNLTPEAQAAAARANREAAVTAYRKIAGYAQLLQASGLSLAAIANKLNSEGHRTRRGKEFQPMTVKRILQRHDG